MKKLKIYLASSWSNPHYARVLADLSDDPPHGLGYDVYDFKRDGFSWSNCNPDWREHRTDAGLWLSALSHPVAHAGFRRDMDALAACDVCIMLHPCGVSAALELGWAAGAQKSTIVYAPGEIRDWDLMVKMANVITSDFDTVRAYLSGLAKGSGAANGVP